MSVAGGSRSAYKVPVNNYILAIDPGADQGWAVLRNGSLVVCGLGQPETFGARCIVERPTIYPHSRVDPNNLITLAIRAGTAAGWAESRGCEIFWVEPRTWKGSISKATHHSRVLKDLTAADRSTLRDCLKTVPGGKRHNVVDAVALAFWFRDHPR